MQLEAHFSNFCSGWGRRKFEISAPLQPTRAASACDVSSEIKLDVFFPARKVADALGARAREEVVAQHAQGI